MEGYSFFAIMFSFHMSPVFMFFLSPVVKPRFLHKFHLNVDVHLLSLLVNDAPVELVMRASREPNDIF